MLAKMMITLQESGCHNINFVTPSHVVPQILSALEKAIEMGLNVPLIYNSSGYDSTDTLRLIDGIIDIYMPDAKFWDPEVAEKTCHAPDYPEVLQSALKEMHRQVGDLIVNESNIALRGLLVRHLVLPQKLAGTKEVMAFISKHISKNTYVNIMPQYRPCGEAYKMKALSSHLREEEFIEALEEAKKAGIKRLDNVRRKLLIY